MTAARVLWLAVGAVALVIGAAGYALLRLSSEPPKFNAVDVAAAPEAIAHDLRLLIERGTG
jgi:hypothetical protein